MKHSNIASDIGILPDTNKILLTPHPMKPLYLFVPLLLAACSSDELLDEADNANADGEMNINAVTERATRGTVADISTLQTAGFYATCKAIPGNYQQEDYFTGAMFTYNANSGLFTSDEHYIYPSGISQVWAWTPQQSGGNISDDGNSCTLQFSTNATLDQQTDLLVAYNDNVSKNDIDLGTPLNFTHALSQIEVRVVQSNYQTNKSYHYQPIQVRLGNIASGGTLTWPEANWTTDETDVSSYETIALTDDALRMLTEETRTMTADTLGGNFFVMPQQREPWDCQALDSCNNGTYIGVKIRVFYNSSTNYQYVSWSYASNGWNANGTDSEGKVWACVPIAADWQPGKKYIYTLDFADGAGYNPNGQLINVNLIRVKSTVLGWSEGRITPGTLTAQ